ncbi:MAG TPA: glycosyltransferase [bacterium]|nr:glycosyltransferase [bacterium]
MKTYFVIIIPCKGYNEYLNKTIKGCLNQTFKDFKIYLLPDNNFENNIFKNDKIVIKSTGNYFPGKKRNIGIEISEAEVYAFIDSDAIPERVWLEKAYNYLKDEKIKIIGGPNLTPAESNLREKISGILLSNFLVTGKFSIRYKKNLKLETVLELPLCNLFIKNEVFKSVGKFKENTLTAEDADFCFRAKKLGIDTKYSSEIVVYHKRRPIFLPYLNQIFQYAFDKGYRIKKNFVPKYLYYFLPSFFLIFLLIGLYSLIFFKNFLFFYCFFISLYFFLVFISCLINWKYLFYIFSGIILTHLVYGSGFIIGLFSKRENEN